MVEPQYPFQDGQFTASAKNLGNRGFQGYYFYYPPLSPPLLAAISADRMSVLFVERLL
jgi:hypothetical protein